MSYFHHLSQFRQDRTVCKKRIGIKTKLTDRVQSLTCPVCRAEMLEFHLLSARGCINTIESNAILAIKHLNNLDKKPETTMLLRIAQSILFTVLVENEIRKLMEDKQ